MKNTPVSIVVASNQPAFLEHITAIVKPNSDMIVVAGCSNGTAAMQAISVLTPTVAVLDFLMPGLTGLNVLARVFADRCATKVVLRTTNNQQALMAFARGAKGAVLKEATPPELLQCIRRVAAGSHWLPSGLADSRLEQGAGSVSASHRVFESLTKREQQVVTMVSNGLSNKAVGSRLDLSEGTVKVHLHNIYRKLGVNNRTALAAMAATCGEHLKLPTYAPNRESYPSPRAENGLFLG